MAHCPAARSGLHSLLLTLTLLAGWPAAPGVAHAEPAEPACDTRAVEEAKRYQQRADSLAQEHKYGDALRELDFAFRLCPNPVLLLNRGEIYESLGQLPEAVFSYRQYLVRRPKGKAVDKALQAIARLEQTLAATHGRVSVDTTPPGAEVRVGDGEALPIQTPLLHWLPAGRHVLVIRKDGFLPVERTVTLAAGQREEMRLALQPQSSAPGASAVAPAVGPALVAAPLVAPTTATPLPVASTPIAPAPVARPPVASPSVAPPPAAPRPAPAPVPPPVVVAPSPAPPSARVAPSPPVVAPRSTPAPAAPPASAATPAGRSANHGTPTWLPVGLTVTGLAAGLGTVLLFVNAGDLETEGDRIATGPHATIESLRRAQRDVQAKYDQAADRRYIGLGLGVAGAAALGTAVYFWLSDDSATPDGAAPRDDKHADGAGLSSGPSWVLGVAPGECSFEARIGW